PASSSPCSTTWGCRGEGERAPAAAAGGHAARAGGRGAAGAARTRGRAATRVPRRRRGAPLPCAAVRAALRDVPEPVAGRFQRADRAGPAPRGVRHDAGRAQRPGDQGVPGRALRRVRAVPAAGRAPHLAAVVRPGAGTAGRRHGGGPDRACALATGRGRGSRGGGTGMVNALVFLLVVVLG